MEEYKYYLSICLIIKDEGEYLPEWLEWHANQGVEHFYIYDNGSAIPVSEHIPDIYKDMCDIKYCANWRNRQQLTAYEDCLNKYKNESKWIAFIDTDEFINPLDGRKLRNFLKDYEDYAALAIAWRMYNADGQIYNTGGPVRERFHQVVDVPHDWRQKYKSIIQPKRCHGMTPHNPYTIDPYITVDENYNYVDERSYNPLPYNKIVVDHYFTKSYEEWCNKLFRGDVMGWNNYDQGTFDSFNPGLIYNFFKEVKQLYLDNKKKGEPIKGSP